MDVNPELLNRPRTMLTRAIPLLFLALIRHFWTMIGCMVLVGALTFGYDSFLRPHSDGHSHITFLAEPRVPEHTPPATLEQIKQWVTFTAELAQSARPRLLSSSLRRFTSSRPSADLDITHGEATVTFTVSSRTPEIAAKINNDIYAEFTRILDGVTKTNVLLLPVDYHSDPTVPHYLLATKCIAVAFVFLLVGFFCKESAYYETIKDPADIKASVDLPTLGLMPFGRDDINLLKQGRKSELADRYEILSYYTYSRGKGLRSVLITSPSTEEGKSTVALNLATVVAWSGRKVVLVDGNWRRPSLHRLFHVPRAAGLADYLRSDVPLESIIVKTECTTLDFIPAGGASPDSGLITAHRCLELGPRAGEEL